MYTKSALKIETAENMAEKTHSLDRSLTLPAVKKSLLGPIRKLVLEKIRKQKQKKASNHLMSSSDQVKNLLILYSSIFFILTFLVLIFSTERKKNVFLDQ